MLPKIDLKDQNILASAWDEANQRWNGKSEDQDYIWNTENNTWEEA